MAERGAMKWRDEEKDNPLEKSEALFEAALEAFAAKSFSEASLNDIIRSACLNKGSFYYRFYDKMDIYLSLIHRMGMEKLAFLKSHDSGPKGDGFFEDLRQKAVFGLMFAKKEPRYMAMSRRILTEDPSVRKAIYQTFGDLSQSFLTDMLRPAIDSGEIRSGIQAKTAALLISAFLEKLDLLISPAAEDEQILSELEGMLEVIKHGLAGRSPGM